MNVTVRHFQAFIYPTQLLVNHTVQSWEINNLTERNIFLFLCYTKTFLIRFQISKLVVFITLIPVGCVLVWSVPCFPQWEDDVQIARRSFAFEINSAALSSCIVDANVEVFARWCLSMRAREWCDPALQVNEARQDANKFLKALMLGTCDCALTSCALEDEWLKKQVVVSTRHPAAVRCLKLDRTVISNVHSPFYAY